MKNIFVYLMTTAMLFIIGCSGSKFVAPLEKGENSLSVNIGGPIIDFHAPIPIPLSSITYGRGLDTNITVFGSLHTTSLLFGNLQLDGGILMNIRNQSRGCLPAVSSSFNLNSIIDLNDKSNRFWPQLDFNLYWKYGKFKKQFFYVGFSNWFELRNNRTQEMEQIDRWLLNPHLGASFVIREKSNITFLIEYKMLAPSHNSIDVFVPYYPLINGKGANGLYLSFIKKF